MKREWLGDKPMKGSNPIFVHGSLFYKGILQGSGKMVYKDSDSDDYVLRRMNAKKGDLLKITLLIEWNREGRSYNRNGYLTKKQ